MFVLAFDHRQSLRRILDAAGFVERAAEVKSLIADAFELALGRSRHPEALAILIDTEIGAPVARRARDAGWNMAIALEATGRRVVELPSDEQLRAVLHEFRPRMAKVLIRHNPGDTEADRRFQMSEVSRVERICDDLGVELMLELLVPPLDADLVRVDGDLERYERELRPALTVDAVSEVRAAGITPDVWKVEGFYGSADYGAVARAAADGLEATPRLLVLGRGARFDVVRRWLGLSKGVPGFEGFAIGRTLWEDLAIAHLEGVHPDAAEQICSRFLELADSLGRL